MALLCIFQNIVFIYGFALERNRFWIQHWIYHFHCGDLSRDNSEKNFFVFKIFYITLYFIFDCQNYYTLNWFIWILIIRFNPWKYNGRYSSTSYDKSILFNDLVPVSDWTLITIKILTISTFVISFWDIKIFLFTNSTYQLSVF